MYELVDGVFEVGIFLPVEALVVAVGGFGQGAEACAEGEYRSEQFFQLGFYKVCLFLTQNTRARKKVGGCKVKIIV